MVAGALEAQLDAVVFQAFGVEPGARAAVAQRVTVPSSSFPKLSTSLEQGRPHSAR